MRNFREMPEKEVAEAPDKRAVARLREGLTETITAAIATEERVDWHEVEDKIIVVFPQMDRYLLVERIKVMKDEIETFAKKVDVYKMASEGTPFVEVLSKRVRESLDFLFGKEVS